MPVRTMFHTMLTMYAPLSEKRYRGQYTTVGHLSRSLARTPSCHGPGGEGREGDRRRMSGESHVAAATAVFAAVDVVI